MSKQPVVDDTTWASNHGVDEQIFPTGEVLSDCYEIRCVLGAGGMGQVFEAVDRRLARRVAIKAPWKWNRGSQHVSMLRREAQALAAIRHPNVMQVHAMGAHRGVEYLVLERIFGVTLREHVDHGPYAELGLPVVEAVEVLIGIADGLGAVHAAGIAHRDVKPSNIMVAAGGRVVLMDLGVFVPEVEVAPETLPIGTPWYMAPEAVQQRGRPGEAHLLDVYSLGVIAFELLTGHLPYDGDTIMRVLMEHASAPIPDLAAFPPLVPLELRQLVRECLAKEPLDRPARIEMVAWQLRALLASLRRPIEVLVVDDDPDMALLLRRAVEDALAPAVVQTARDGESALGRVQRRAPDLILLDLAMPGMNGIELCMYLRGDNMLDRHSKIVAVSGHAGPGERELLARLGVHELVEKGPDLPARIARALACICSPRFAPSPTSGSSLAPTLPPHE